eukprot:s2340_g28.t1
MAQFQGQSEVFLRVWRLLDAMPEDPDDGVMREKWEKERREKKRKRLETEDAQKTARIKVAPQEDQNLGQEEAVTHQFRQEPPQKAPSEVKVADSRAELFAHWHAIQNQAARRVVLLKRCRGKQRPPYNFRVLPARSARAR